MKDTILSIVGLLVLFFPTALKVWRDRNGVKHPDPTFLFLIALMIGMGWVKWAMDVWGTCPCPDHLKQILLWVKYSIVSWCLYTAIFPYWINYVHLKNGVTEARVKIMSVGSKLLVDGVAEYLECTRKEVFLHVVSHLSKSAWPDKTWWWRALGWRGRMIVNTLILIGGLILYFI